VGFGGGGLGRIFGEGEVGGDLGDEGFADAGDGVEVFRVVEDDGVGGEGFAGVAVGDDVGGEFFAEVGDAGEVLEGGGVGVDGGGEVEGLAADDHEGVVETCGAVEELKTEKKEEQEEE
jgi:hypothetical protein